MSGNSAKNAALGASLASSFASELKALEIPAEVPEGAPMSQLHLAADAVNMNATKTQMLFSDGNGVDATAARPWLTTSIESYSIDTLDFYESCPSCACPVYDIDTRQGCLAA